MHEDDKHEMQKRIKLRQTQREMCCSQTNSYLSYVFCRQGIDFGTLQPSAGPKAGGTSRKGTSTPVATRVQQRPVSNEVITGKPERVPERNEVRFEERYCRYHVLGAASTMRHQVFRIRSQEQRTHYCIQYFLPHSIWPWECSKMSPKP
jgi:hypothetical protein